MAVPFLQTRTNFEWVSGGLWSNQDVLFPEACQDGTVTGGVGSLSVHHVVLPGSVIDVAPFELVGTLTRNQMALTPGSLDMAGVDEVIEALSLHQVGLPFTGVLVPCGEDLITLTVSQVSLPVALVLRAAGKGHLTLSIPEFIQELTGIAGSIGEDQLALVPFCDGGGLPAIEGSICFDGLEQIAVRPREGRRRRGWGGGWAGNAAKL